MKKQQIYPEMSRKERKLAMEKVCYREEYETYQAPLPADELSAEQDAYSRRAIELKKAKEEFAAYKKKKAAEIKAVEEEMAVQLEVINTGQREMEGNLYMFQDLQTNDMNYFDVNGMLVRSRKIRPEERQTTMAIGLSDVAVNDEERDNQDIEDVHAVDVTEPASDLGTVDMPSEYAAMDSSQQVTGTIEERPDDNETGEAVGGFGDVTSNDFQEEQSAQLDNDAKQDEAQAKMDAHKRNKKRMSKAASAQLNADIAATSQGDIDADNATDVDEFALPID